MLKVLIADKLSAAAVEVFAQNGITAEVKTGLDKDALLEIIGDYDGLAVRSSTKVTPSLLEKASKLKVVGRAGIGIDNIDLPASTQKGVIVMNAPAGNSITTAEHAIAMMLSLAREIPQADRSTQAGKWEKSRFMGVELTNKTLGIVGCGNVGSLVAERALGLKLQVIAHDPFLSPERATQLGVKKVELDELFANADWITLHTPLTPKTKHIINKENISKMKKGVRLINCARGDLVDEAALKAGIESGQVAGAALDVFAAEPAKENILFGMEQVICTPHLGASTTEAQEKVALQIAEQMSNYLTKGVIMHALNMPSVSAEVAPRLEPFIRLADHLGTFVGELSYKGIDRIKIEYVGEEVQKGKDSLTAALLAGALKPFLDGVNMVSAPARAKESGITVSENIKAKTGAYENYILVSLQEGDETYSVAGTVFSDGKPRIIQASGVNMEAEFVPYMLYIEGEDRPGFIGKVGEFLGAEGVNIASMALGRKEYHGKAMMIVEVDDAAKPAMLEKLRAVPQITRVEAMEFVNVAMDEDNSL